jgi:hypothetical protein
VPTHPAARRGGGGSPGRAPARRLRPTRPPTRSLRSWPKALGGVSWMVRWVGPDAVR